MWASVRSHTVAIVALVPFPVSLPVRVLRRTNPLWAASSVGAVRSIHVASVCVCMCDARGFVCQQGVKVHRESFIAFTERVADLARVLVDLLNVFISKGAGDAVLTPPPQLERFRRYINQAVQLVQVGTVVCATALLQNNAVWLLFTLGKVCVFACCPDLHDASVVFQFGLRRRRPQPAG